MPKPKRQPDTDTTTVYDVVSSRDGEAVIVGLEDPQLASDEAERLTAEARAANPAAHATYDVLEREQPPVPADDVTCEVIA